MSVTDKPVFILGLDKDHTKLGRNQCLQSTILTNSHSKLDV